MSSLQTFLSTRKRIKQKATVGSLLVVLMLFGLFLEAYMHNFNLVYIVLFFVFALAFIAAIVGIENFTNLHLSIEQCDRLFAKEEAFAYLTLFANKAAKSYALNFNCVGQHLFIPVLAGNKQTRLSLRLVPPNRGTFKLEGCSLESHFPLSTARLIMPLDINQERIVYPQPRGISLEAFINRTKSHYGEENEFEGIVSTLQNAALSRIHWPSVAKGERAIKKFDYDIPLETLVFDFYMAGNNDEERLSQLTLWILECERRSLEFKLKMPSILYDSKKSSVDEILENFARY